MNPAPSLYSAFVKAHNQLKCRIKNSLGEVKALSGEEGAG